MGINNFLPRKQQRSTICSILRRRQSCCFLSLLYQKQGLLTRNRKKFNETKKMVSKLRTHSSSRGENFSKPECYKLFRIKSRLFTRKWIITKSKSINCYAKKQSFRLNIAAISTV